jgi:ATP-dependent helicase/nuclease subunit B
LPDPVEIEIEPGVMFKLRGIIDRIDQVPGDPPRYGVWDYKTGGTYGYQESQYLNKGRQLQHALYAIAAEKILEQAGLSSPVVSEGGYIFPTQKGEGITYSRDQRKRQQLLSALSRMFKLLSSGTFCVTDEDRCKFCDYQELCRVSSARQQIKVKLENQANSMLEPWEELQKYE